ncbi:MAG: hypothetical protein ACUVTU_10065, partial [Desulfurispora sp.]|uniref:hypothetical protein n=1 Tax=Desulfurispora sp. TaxID=3014275 RepID=UPI00404BA165
LTTSLTLRCSVFKDRVTAFVMLPDTISVVNTFLTFFGRLLPTTGRACPAFQAASAAKVNIPQKMNIVIW